MNKRYQIALICFAFLGAAIMAYLTYVHFSLGGGSFCDLGDGLSCDIVNKSDYATILGIPIALLGFIYFLGIFLIAVFRFQFIFLRWTFFVSLVVLGPALYLTVVEMFILKNYCIFCELAKICILAVMITLALAIGVRSLERRSVMRAVVIALLLIAGTYLMQAAAQPAVGQYDAFAQCLSEKGFVMYGSATCTFCIRQKGAFGSSFQYIKNVECNKNFPGAQPELCAEKKIQYTPTWIKEGPERTELQRLNPGFIELEKLAEISGCTLKLSGA
ncbi:MAG: hypothetical protein A3B29_02485 [Candidatus Sungbacteria bacterium RIFCSPLOWO2_01_FULL_51_34]|nr:MAG: hypothetical protein A3B29_02485 [Candidatus Sungbacteria bacterium RIFCSPLOWO2_01_FULL_51_34]